jgi:HAD superfamily hydrolase (TIGR01509 family)
VTSAASRRAIAPAKAVLIDVGGTLWPAGPVVPGVAGIEARNLSPEGFVSKCAERLGRLLLLDDADAQVLAAGLADDAYERVNERQATDAHIAAVIGRLGWNDRSLDLLRTREAMCIPGPEIFELFPGAVELLRAMRRSGARTALVSNTQWRTGETYRRDFNHWGVADCIDAYVTSLDVGFRKPHPAMFHAALEALQVSAAASVMIGDSLRHDIQPARALGMRTVLVAIEDKPPARCPADFVARSMSEVEQWLAENQLPNSP